MSVIELAIYAEDDPNGTPVVTLDETDLLTCELRPAAYETGDALFSISLHHAAAGFIQDDRLVKVTIPSVSANPIWAFWLKNTRASIVHHDEQGGEIGTFGGPGMLAILGLGQLNSEHYAPAQPERGSVSEIGIWKWINEPYGAILTRGIEEGQYQPGYPLADVTIDFDRDLDSDGVAWVNIAEDFQVQIGTGLGRLTSQLVEAGDLKLVGHPNLLVQAFHSYGRDLTGSFGAGTVRFEKGVNIITELVRAGNARQKWTHVLLRDKDGEYSEEVDPGFGAGDRAHWGFWSADQTNDEAMLNRIGQEVIDASHTHPEAIELEITPGFVPASGRYMPGPEGTNGHFWLFDRITLDANVGSFGYNEAEQEIVAIRIVLDVAAVGTTADTSARSLHIVPELNYRAHRYDVPPAQVIPFPPGSGSSFFSCDNIGAGAATGKWVNGSVETNANGWKRTPNITVDPAFLSTAQAHAGSWSVLCSAHNTYFFTGQTFDAGTTYLFTWWSYRIGDGEGNARVGYGTKHAVVGLDSTSKAWTAGYAAAGTWVQYCMPWTPTSTWTDGVGIDFHFSGGYIDDCVVYEGVAPDLPLPPAEDPVAGDPGQFAPLAHQHQQQSAGTVPYDGNDAGSSSITVQDAIDRIHPVESDTDPAVTDDAHHVGTVWVNTVSNTIYVLIDNTTGAAVWQDVSEVIPDGTYVTAVGGGKEVVSTVAASGATETLDLADGNWHDVTLTADCTLTLTGATNGVGCSMLLLLRQDGTGGRAVTWPGSVAWPGGLAPTLAADPNDVTIVSLLSEDGGTTWFGAYPGAGGGALDPDDVRDAGRWEVIVSGSAPPVAVTNEAADDWVYGWSPG